MQQAITAYLERYSIYFTFYLYKHAKTIKITNEVLIFLEFFHTSATLTVLVVLRVFFFLWTFANFSNLYSFDYVIVCHSLGHDFHSF